MKVQHLVKVLSVFEMLVGRVSFSAQTITEGSVEV